MPEFDLSQQSPSLIAFQTLRGQPLSTQFLDRLCRIRFDMTVFNKPTEEPPQHHQHPIDGRDCLLSIPSQVITKIGDIPDCNTLNAERFAIRGSKPFGELPQVCSERFARVLGEVVGVETPADLRA